MPLNKNTIKAGVRKLFPNVKIKEIRFHKFGMFTVSVTEDRPKSVKIGFLMGETDFDKVDNGCLLDQKITWA